MFAYIYSEAGTIKFGELDDVEPICGEHFCDECGDCLHCYGGDPCYPGHDAGSHRWVVYGLAEARRLWRAKKEGIA